MSRKHLGIKIVSSAVMGYAIGSVLAGSIPATFTNILISWVILFPLVVLKDAAIDKLLD